MFIRSLFILFLGSFLYANAGVQAGKGTYDFAFEYEFSKGDDGTLHAFEIDNEFGISDNASVGINFWVEKAENESRFKYAEFYHLYGFGKGSFDFGIRNMLRFYGTEGEGKNYTMYELRGIAKHSTVNSFYDSSKVLVMYRRNFSQENSDILKAEFHLNFNLNQSMKWISRVETVTALYKGVEKDENVIDYKFNRSFNFSSIVLYTGLSFDLPRDSSFYIQYRRDLGGEASDSRNGVFVGIAKSFDI